MGKRKAKFGEDNKGFKYILAENFKECIIDGKTRKEISFIYPKREDGAYYLDKFCKYLKEYHNIEIIEYFEKFFDDGWPVTKDTGEKLNYKVYGKGFRINKFIHRKVNRKNCKKFDDACKKFSAERVGEGNPMYGKEAWNKGIGPDSDFVKNLIKRQTGKKFSEKSKKKMSESAKKRDVHGHTGFKHSQENINKFRKSTANGWATGRYSKETSIEKAVRVFLEKLKTKSEFESQHRAGYFALDFAFPERKIAIECQGQYYHSDPRFYPDGPQTEMQKKNWRRDRQKKGYLKKNGWFLIELWEKEINNGDFEEILLCNLQELKVLEA